MLYVASPYSFTHHNKSYVRSIHHHRFTIVRNFTAELISSGLIAFSPIVYAHDMAIIHKFPTDAQFWDRFNLTILRRCDRMIFFRMQGWEQSKGMARERSIAEAIHLPISDVACEDEEFPIEAHG